MSFHDDNYRARASQWSQPVRREGEDNTPTQPMPRVQAVQSQVVPGSENPYRMFKNPRVPFVEPVEAGQAQSGRQEILRSAQNGRLMRPTPPPIVPPGQQEILRSAQNDRFTRPTPPPVLLPERQEILRSAQNDRLMRPTPPPPSYEFTEQRNEKGRWARPVAVLLVVLAVLIASSSVFALYLSLNGTLPGQAQALPTGPVGAFEGVPLNPRQVNQLQHLSSYMQYKQLASMYVQRMTLDEEIGQLIMVEYSDTSYSSDLGYMISQLHAGGVIMYAFQMNTFAQTKHDIAEMQQNASIPLLISTDEEGGPYVERLGNIYGTRMDATQIGASGDVNVAIQQGQKVAHDLLALGINENLAPDVDVNLVNGYDMVTRTFGSDPQTVIKYASAYIAAMQGAGAIGCIKHFPGLGDAVPDAHATLPVVNRTAQQIYDVELAPFKALIQSSNPLERPGMVMPTDVLMPAIDPKMPAELSPIFMTDILRKQFGYDGVVLTDALYMQGISDTWSMPEAGVLALKAGDDMLLGPNGSGQMLDMINAIKQALQDGTLTKARIDEAATRIIALKMQYHLLPATIPQG